MKKICFCTFLLLLTGIIKHSYAQSSGILQGTIVDQNLTAAEAATVVLLLRDSSLYRTGITNKKGWYLFADLKPQEYIIQVTKPGYRQYHSHPYHITEDKPVIADTIRLSPFSVTLNEVAITDKRRYIDVRPDKTILNLDRSIWAAGTSAMEVLATAPGIKTDNTGRIIMRGGQSAGIMVNGKMIKLGDEDLATYLQSIQSANIDQIELIQNPSAKYGAEGNGGLVNIILKKGKNLGFNGTAAVSGGTGRYQQYNASFTGNYRSKKFNVFGNAGYQYKNPDHTINQLRNVKYNDTLSSLDTRYHNTLRNPVFNFGIGTDYFIDSAHTVGFLIKGNHDESRFNKNTHTNLVKNGINDSVFTTLSDLKRTINNINYNLNYSGRLGHTKQTLSADADLYLYKRNNDEQIRSIGLPSPKTILNDKSLLQNTNDSINNTAPTRYTNSTIKIDYINPISSSARLEAGIKGSYINNKNSQDFDVLTNTGYEPDPLLTSRFTYKEKTESAYASYIKTGTLLSYTLGLNVVHTSSNALTYTDGHEVDRDYTQLFPAVELGYKTSKQNLFSFNYNRSFELPQMESLNPIVMYQDNYNYRIGNSYLKPAYSNNFQLAYTLKDKYIFALYTQTTSNFWHFTYFRQADSTKTLITTNRNIDKVNNYGVRLNIPFDVTKWWNINFNADLSYYQFKDNSIGLNKGAKDFIFKLNQDFSFTQTLTATLQGFYESPTYYGLYSTRPTYYLNAAISKQLFDHTASLTLSANDIFNTDKYRYLVTFSDLDISGYDKRATQIVRLSFTYRFGKKTVKAARRHLNGNDDEQRRMGSSN